MEKKEEGSLSSGMGRILNNFSFAIIGTSACKKHIFTNRHFVIVCRCFSGFRMNRKYLDAERLLLQIRYCYCQTVEDKVLHLFPAEKAPKKIWENKQLEIRNIRNILSRHPSNAIVEMKNIM